MKTRPHPSITHESLISIVIPKGLDSEGPGTNNPPPADAVTIPAFARGAFHLPPAANTPTAMPSDGQLGDEFGYAERIEC